MQDAVEHERFAEKIRVTTLMSSPQPNTLAPRSSHCRFRSAGRFRWAVSLIDTPTRTRNVIATLRANSRQPPDVTSCGYSPKNIMSHMKW